MIITKISDFLRGTDLKKTQHYFAIRNETSGTKVIDFEKIVPCELGNNFLILKMPHKTCQKGQKLILNIFDSKYDLNEIKKKVKASNYKESMEVYTKVEIIEEDDTSQNVTLSFLEFEEHKWKSFLNLYKNIQAKISKISSSLSPDLEIEIEDDEQREAS